MDELEMERQKFLVEFKERKRNAKIKAAIIMIILTLLFSVVVAHIAGIEYLCFIQINSFIDLLDINKIYLYLLSGGVVYLMMCLIIEHGDVCIGNYDDYKKVYRRVVATKVLEEIFDDVEIDYSRGFDKEMIADIGIVEMSSTFKSEDYCRGKYKGISFEVCDIETTHRTTDSDGHTSTVTDFKGQYYIFESKKTVNEKVSVLSQVSKTLKKRDDYIEIDNPEFNKEYTVLSNNKEAVYQVVTPGLIEKIELISEEEVFLFHLNFCFIDNKVHLAIFNYKDMFEFDPVNELNLDEEKEKIKELFELDIKVIEILISEKLI